MDTDAVPGRIVEVRKAKGLRQKDLATRLGVSPSLISLVEKGARAPQDQLIRSICNALQINEHWLRTGEGPMLAGDGAQAANGVQNDRLVVLNSHQSLVSRFKQRELAEEINHLLLEIEAIEPARLGEVRANLIATRNYLLERRTPHDRDGMPAPKKNGVIT